MAKTLTKNFIGIATAIHNNKVVLVQASNGKCVKNISGLSFDAIIDFLFSLRLEKKQKSNTVFVCYGFQRDNEFIFSSLPNDAKDRLFQSHYVRKRILEIEYDQEKIDSDRYHIEKDSQEYERLDFESHVNKLALLDLIEVYHNGYFIQLQNGKRLVIRKDKKQFVLYDVFGFFRKPLYSAFAQWLGRYNQLLNPHHRVLIPRAAILPQLQQFAHNEAVSVAKITEALNTELQANGINLQRFHGAGAISSWILSKGKAKSKNPEINQYHNYRHKRQLAPELYIAMMQSYYGGRAEQFKIGTITDQVNVYDINSAYANAISRLPVLLKKPVYSKTYNYEPFSIWHCEYDFSSINPYFGLLPNRERGHQQVTYKISGRGYFWQPEVSYILQHYPQCITINKGFYTEYEQAPFTQVVLDIYELRCKLQRERHPLEKVLKVALSSIYGKFCQAQGKGHYYNMFYAGFVTSFARRNLLEATKGYEDQTVCFLTDAIHTTATLPVSCSQALGDYKLTQYTRGEYIDCGIYRLYGNDGEVKEASRGHRVFDFDAALSDLNKEYNYKGVTEFFVGHNLHTLSPLIYPRYLELRSEIKKTNPTESSVRKFLSAAIDLTQGYIDSRSFALDSGLESALYQPNTYREADIAKDSLVAEKV